jgi:hypothetical protein
VALHDHMHTIYSAKLYIEEFVEFKFKGKDVRMWDRLMIGGNSYEREHFGIQSIRRTDKRVYFSTDTSRCILIVCDQCDS